MGDILTRMVARLTPEMAWFLEKGGSNVQGGRNSVSPNTRFALCLAGVCVGRVDDINGVSKCEGNAVIY